MVAQSELALLPLAQASTARLGGSFEYEQVEPFVAGARSRTLVIDLFSNVHFELPG